MRWLAGLFALGLTMALFTVVTAAAPLEARASLALGFLLLAATLGGDIARRYALPRITGFIVAGVVAGPAGLALVRADEVDALRFLSDGAAALIALAAGATVRLRLLRLHGRALVSAGTGAIAFPLLAVALFVLAASWWFPLTVNQPWGDRVTIALVLGALAAASSPLVTAAVMDEMGAQGPFARLLLALTILKDVAVIVVAAVILWIGRLISSAGALDPHALWRAPLLLLASVALGVAAGWAASRFLRAYPRGTVFVLAGFAFVAAAAGRLLGLDVLVVALVTGGFVANVTQLEEAVLPVLRPALLPAYAVWFVVAGAGLQLASLSTLWPWVLLIAALRALGLRYGLLWAGRDVAVPPRLAQDGWLGLVSQAGVALGLATVVRRAFPEWGVSLEAFVLAMIGVHEVLGPVLLRRALQRAADQEGEVRSDAEAVPAGGADLGRVGVR